MKLSHRLSISCFPLFAFTFGSAAWAIPPSAVPPSAEPGLTSQRLEIQEERPAVGGESVITIPDENGHAAKLDNKITFTLKAVVLEGNTAIPTEDLRPDYESYIGKPVTLDALNKIAGKITAHYRNAGYILSRAVVPPQHIENGTVKIRVVEGYVNKVEFRGIPVDSGVLRDYADKIQNDRPLSEQDLERYLLLMNDLPGISAQAVVHPSPNTPGASDLVITIAEKHVDGSATLDNRGTRYLGPIEGGITANANDVLGLNERTQFHGVMTPETNELKYGQLVHEEQLDSEGTKIAFSYSRTDSHPAYKLADDDIYGIDDDYSAALSHPFIRSRQSNLYGTFTLEARETNNDSLGSQLYHDSLRIMRLDSSYDFVDGLLGVNRFEATASHGIGWDTEDPGSARSTDGHPEFYKGNFSASRLQPISGPFSAYIAATGQAASDTLFSAEEFGIGGANFGSAYDPDEIIGDSGAVARGELRFSRSGDFEYIPSYQLYGFYDIGKVWIRDPGTISPSEESLADTGVGVRFNVLQPLSGSLELAEPLTREVAADGQDGSRPRVFFSLAYRY